MLEGLRRRWQRAREQQGLAGALLAGLKKPWQALAGLPARLGRQARPASAPSSLDAQWGLDTDGLVDLASLDIKSPNWTAGVRYQPTPLQHFNEMLGQLEIDYSQYVFIDFGSGKGRVLLMAARLPFQEIIGVEFAPELHQIALANLQKFQAATGKGHNVRPLLADATQFAIPEQPAVFYFYNPFGPVVLAQVLANIGRSLAAWPRVCYLVYYNPVHQELLTGAGIWECLVRHPEYRIYRSRP